MSFNKKTNEYEGYIYLITNLINDKKYVGQTIRTINNRWSGHITESKRLYTTMAIARAINKYGKDNFKIEELEKISNPSQIELEKQLNELEKRYIIKYDSTNHCYGYNIDEGGRTGTVNKKPVDIYFIDGSFIETLDSRTEVEQKYGITVDVVAQICDGRVGNYDCMYVLRNHGESFDLHSIISSYYIEIYAFDITNTKMVKKFYSIQQASEFVNVYSNSIRMSLDNPHMQIKGYWWSTKPMYNYQGRSNAKAIDLYKCDTLEFVGTFDTVASCAMYVNTSTSNISAMCKGKKYSIKGYITRYNGDDIFKYKVNTDKSFTTRMVNKYSLDDQYIETFNTLLDGARSCGSDSCSFISGCCKHKEHYKSAYGYKWYYADDQNQPDKSKIITNSQEKAS